MSTDKCISHLTPFHQVVQLFLRPGPGLGLANGATLQAHRAGVGKKKGIGSVGESAVFQLSEAQASKSYHGGHLWGLHCFASMSFADKSRRSRMLFTCILLCLQHWAKHHMVAQDKGQRFTGKSISPHPLLLPVSSGCCRAMRGMPANQQSPHSLQSHTRGSLKHVWHLLHAGN